MNEAQRVLEILLKLKADTAGGSQIRAEIQAIQADQAKLASQLAAPNASVVQSQAAQITQQNLINGLMERRVIMETQLEAAEARIAGNPAMAAKLEREAAIRTQALTIQRTLNVTTEESIALAERMTVAQEATNVSVLGAGASLNKAKGEAMVLARELATGSVNARTMGAFLGSLGTTLTVASIAGFELYQLIAHAGDKELELSKESQKHSVELDKQVDKWLTLAATADSFGDVARLRLDIAPVLEAARAKLIDFRRQEVSEFQKILDWLKESAAGLANLGVPGMIGFGKSDRQTREEEKKKASAELFTIVQDQNALIDASNASLSEWNQIKLEPTSEAISDITLKTQELREQLGELDQARKVDAGATEEQVLAASKSAEKYNAVNAELQVWEHRLTEVKAKDVNSVLREQAIALQNIHQQQQLINAHPFLTADQKQALTLQLMTAELLRFHAAIEQDKALLQDSSLDPALHERLQAQLQKDQFEFDLLRLKIEAINKPLAAELFDWVNQFGTSAHQIAGFIEGSINASLEGTNQLLLDAAFRTGNWQQTVVGVERQILGLFLKTMEQMILQHTLGETQKATSTATAMGQGAAIAAAHAPAAAATSISTSGISAIVGEIAALAAIAAIIAALSGAFAKGGLTGTNQIARVGEEGPEFVFTHKATRNIGAENLYAMMHAAENAPHFGVGGRLSSEGFIYPPYTTGRFPNNPAADTYFYEHNLATRFAGGITGNSGISGSGDIVFDPDLTPEAFGIWYPTNEPLPIPIEPGDLTQSPAPPFVVVNSDGLPIVPGIDPNEPTIAAGPQPYDPVTVYRGAPGSRGAPYWNTPGGGYAFTPNYIGNFGGNFSLPFFAPWSGLGYGTRSPVEAGNIFTANNPPTYNSALGVWQQWDPVAHSFVVAPPPTRFDPGFIDPATGLPVPSSGSRSGSSPSATINSPSSRPTGTHWDFTQGRYVSNNNATGAQFSTQAADLLMMWYQGLAGNPNMPGVADAGHDIFQHPGRGIRGYFDPEQGAIIHIPGGADGMRLPGPASRADNILAWLSTGERVVPADRNILLEKHFGFDWDKRLELAMPHFAAGGRVGTRIEDRGSRMAAEGDVHVYIFDDRRKAQRAYEESPHARKIFRDRLQRYS